jgi:subtilisin family serine protease
VPVVSVGALNPNQTTVALFSNTGPSVRTYAPGVSVVSTMPPLQGGLEPMARTTAFGFERESLDLDNFSRGDADARRGGFAVWSGTSFAAPVVAGRIARQLGPIPQEGDNGNKRDAVTRGWDAVEKVTTLRR